MESLYKHVQNLSDMHLADALRELDVMIASESPINYDKSDLIQDLFKHVEREYLDIGLFDSYLTIRNVLHNEAVIRFKEQFGSFKSE